MTTTTTTTWTGLIALLTEARGRMCPAKWQAIRNDLFTRRAAGVWNTDYSDIIERLI